MDEEQIINQPKNPLSYGYKDSRVVRFAQFECNRDRVHKFLLYDAANVKPHTLNKKNWYVKFRAKCLEDIPEINLKANQKVALELPAPAYEFCVSDCQHREEIEINPNKRYNVVLYWKKITKMKMTFIKFKPEEVTGDTNMADELVNPNQEVNL